MNARIAALALSLAFAAPLSVHAAAAPQPTVFTSAADVQALIAKAAREAKPDQPLLAQPMAVLEPYRANLEYRTAAAPAAVHETEAELFYVIEGAGTLVTGGRLVGETRANAENLRGTGVEGGETRKVSKGDLFIVPEGSPHWFSAVEGRLVMMSLHLPRAASR